MKTKNLSLSFPGWLADKKTPKQIVNEGIASGLLHSQIIDLIVAEADKDEMSIERE